MKNEYDDGLVSRICKPVDTMYHHQLKQDVPQYLFTRFNIKRSTTNIFLSLDVYLKDFSVILFNGYHP
jgi:hypothetical protein